MDLDKEELTSIAELARIRFTDRELEEIGERLADATEIFRDFDAFDLSGEIPTESVCRSVNVLRDDVVVKYGYGTALLTDHKNAPDVPRVVEKER